MSIRDTGPFLVGEWLVEPELLCISRKGDIRRLEFRTMEILLCLASYQGEVVSKKKLHQEVWKEVYVTDNALTRTVSKLRKAFDDDPLNVKYIDTISKSGYRLVAPVAFEQDYGSLKHSVSSMIRKRRSFWALTIAFIVACGIGLTSISIGDRYSKFYDPIPVSTLVGPERAHAISPDGEKISFSYSEPNANNSDVYVKLLNDLSLFKFTDLESHQGYGIWSPDGNYMAYASVEDGTCGIYKEPSFGGEKTRIGDCYSSPEDFIWSPDGKTIAFTDFKSPQQSRRIFFLDLATQVAKEIKSPENGTSHRDPAFSNDGKYLIFRIMNEGQGDIYKMKLADKTLSRLTFDNSRIFGLDFFDNDNQIVFSSNRGGQWALWRVPFDGGDVTRFYINDRILLEPKVSINGKRMIYKSVIDQTQLWYITNGKIELQEPSRLVSSTRADMHPSLSLDGTMLVFISNRSGYFEIWSNDLASNNLTKLTSFKGDFVSMPSWSPNGSEIIFDARINGNSAIYILDVASKMMRKFTDMEADQVNARYSNDGKIIYFATNHLGSWQIWKKSKFEPKATGTQVTSNGGFYSQEGFKDDYLYFTRRDTSGIWRIKDGREIQPEQFISNVGDFDWGSWIAIEKGIIYLNRNAGTKMYFQSYDKNEPPTVLFSASKKIQLSSPTLTASMNGKKIILAQIENSEDEIMMVDF